MSESVLHLVLSLQPCTTHAISATDQHSPQGGSKNKIRAAPIVALRPHPGYLSGDHLARGGQVGEGKCPARDACQTILDSFRPFDK